MQGFHIVETPAIGICQTGMDETPERQVSLEQTGFCGLGKSENGPIVILGVEPEPPQVIKRPCIEFPRAMTVIIIHGRKDQRIILLIDKAASVSPRAAATRCPYLAISPVRDIVPSRESARSCCPTNSQA